MIWRDFLARFTKGNECCSTNLDPSLAKWKISVINWAISSWNCHNTIIQIAQPFVVVADLPYMFDCGRLNVS